MIVAIAMIVKFSRKLENSARKLYVENIAPSSGRCVIFTPSNPNNFFFQNQFFNSYK